MLVKFLEVGVLFPAHVVVDRIDSLNCRTEVSLLAVTRGCPQLLEGAHAFSPHSVLTTKQLLLPVQLENLSHFLQTLLKVSCGYVRPTQYNFPLIKSVNGVTTLIASAKCFHLYYLLLFRSKSQISPVLKGRGLCKGVVTRGQESWSPFYNSAYHR